MKHHDNCCSAPRFAHQPDFICCMGDAMWVTETSATISMSAGAVLPHIKAGSSRCDVCCWHTACTMLVGCETH